MNILRTAEFRVGLLITVVMTLLAVMVVQVSEDPSLYGRTRKTWFLVNNASGLVKNSQVKMAGIGIGVIKSITLQDGQARIDLIVRRDINLTKSSSVELRANGILGDKHIELIAGNPNDPMIEDGEPITNVKNLGSMDEMMNRVGEVTDSLNDVAKSLKAATSNEGDRNSTIGRILLNIESLTKDLSEFSGGNKNKLTEIVNNLHTTTETIDDLVNDESDEGFRAAWTSAVASLKRMDRTMSNVEQITDKVNNGEGTLGKLINDEETVQEINKAVTGVNEFLGSAKKIQTYLDVHSEFLMRESLYKTHINVRVQPGLDRYYEFGVVADPKGVVETTQSQVSTAPGGPTDDDTTTTEKKTYKNRLKFNALFALNIYDFTFKGGMIESSGGVGIDYNFFRKKLKLSTEFFDVRQNSSRLRSSLRYNFMRGMYVIGGADDLVSRNVTSYLGAGIDLSNDDLKSLVSFMF